LERVADGVGVVALRTPTLPPATHTNTYVVGDGRLTVVDPASPWEDEQATLLTALDDRARRGERVERIVLTHHHADHVGGAVALRAATGAPIVAHPVTRDLLAGQVDVDGTLGEGDVLDCGGRRLTWRFTPGHAPGHVVGVGDNGVVIAGDLVAGIGTILIDPDEGDLGLYLDSLERIRVGGARVLLPSHGPPLEPAGAVLSMYVAHRHGRTARIRDALVADGAQTPEDLVPAVYGDLPPLARWLAARQIRSHLAWMARHGVVVAEGGRWRATP
jgi:ribonuclease/clavin/mitogillin